MSNETCILISLSRNSIENKKEYDSVQEGTQEIGNTMIDDIFQLFPIVQKYGIPLDSTPKLHSVFLQSGGEFLAGGDFEDLPTFGIASAVYTLPMLTTEQFLDVMDISLLKNEISSGKGFLDVAKKISTFHEEHVVKVSQVGSEDVQDVVIEVPRSTSTFTIIPESKRVLYMLTTSLDIPMDQIDVYDLKPLELIDEDTISRSGYFANGFFPLNSIISVIIYPENDYEVKNINAPIIGDLSNIDELEQGGWFTYSFQVNATSIDEQSDRLDMKYFFGTESSVSKQQLEIRSVPLGEELPPARIGGCLIATAAFGSEMAPQVQLLRELRDNTVLQTESGSAFMTGFNQFFYSFSPAIADYERQNPIFNKIIPMPYPSISDSESMSAYCNNVSDVRRGVNVSFTASLNIGFCLS